MNNLLGKWGAYVLLFLLMAFMGATLWVSTVIPSHNAKRLEEIQKVLDERQEKFNRIDADLVSIEKLQSEHHKAITAWHKEHQEKKQP